MAYVDKAALEARFGKEELLQLADRNEDDAVDADVLAAAIDQAGSEIDGYLRTGGYTAPLVDVPELIKGLAANLTRYHLDVNGDSDGAVATRYKASVATLKQIAARTVRLGPDADGDQPARRVGIKASHDPAIFSQATLTGYRSG